jgi:tol-pal system protein YbgF
MRRPPKLAAPFLLALVAAAAPGCFWVTTKDEGDRMRKQLKDLDVRVSKTEQSLDQRVKTLDESIDKATKILARNSADLGTQVDKFSQDLATTSGQIEMMQRTVDALRASNAQTEQMRADAETRAAALATRVDALEKALGVKPGPGAGTGPTTAQPTIDKNQLFDQANQKLQQGQYAEARRLFRLFVQNFPQDDRADNALYFVGQSFLKEKDYEHAIAEFQRVIDTYPNGDMADDAYSEAGTAAAAEQECRAAAAYWGELVKKFPKSPFAKPATQKLDYLRKHAKDPKVCKPG